MEVTAKDLRQNLRGELEAEIKLLEALPKSEIKRLEEEVYSSFRFDLCAACASALREDAGDLLKKGRGNFLALPGEESI